MTVASVQILATSFFSTHHATVADALAGIQRPVTAPAFHAGLGPLRGQGQSQRLAEDAIDLRRTLLMQELLECCGDQGQLLGRDVHDIPLAQHRIVGHRHQLQQTGVELQDTTVHRQIGWAEAGRTHLLDHLVAGKL